MYSMRRLRQEDLSHKRAVGCGRKTLIFISILPILLALYGLAMFISLIALSLGVIFCTCDNCLTNGLLVVGDSFVKAGNKVFEGSMRINENNQEVRTIIIHIGGQQLQSSLDTLRSTEQSDYQQNQHPIPVPNVQMAINQHNKPVYQQRHLQQQAPPSVDNITINYPNNGFTYEELLVATNSFSIQNFLGEGGLVLCIKEYYLMEGRWQLSRYFGCCITQDKKLIVCEYMPNKTIDYHLHCRSEGTIDWQTSLKIAIGAAKGLAYLHEECQPRIIHRDIKAANILLDPSFEAKVADFGMVKIFPDGISQIVATNLIGTHGYLAPEFSAGEISDKSDTFSFGVVLLELITGKRPIITCPVSSGDTFAIESLANWAKSLLREVLQNGNYKSIVDLRLCNIYNYDEMKRMIACAAACIQKTPRDRPLMSKVALVLAGLASPDDLYIGFASTEIHTALASSIYSEESS